MLNKYKNIIWDWNGTILDDSALCVEIVNEFLKDQNNKQLDLDRYKEVFGFPITAYYERIGIDFSIESFDDLTIKFMASYNEKVKKCKLQSGIVNVFKDFNKKGLRQYILTAGHKESVIELLHYYHVFDVFIDIEGLDNHRAESKIVKGHQLIKNNHIDVQSTVLIGDTIHDFEVANALSFDCVLIANGHQSYKRLKKNVGNGQVLNDVSELLLRK